ncbi:unnamed protein product [Eruca vesicaria subsp. sativa]|uniref:Uncharacterized protein n=1 Tax=Eruca vesicaria subsp. sativa TaxID=29727 RepID=A0ABC8LP89_ERUVS|nr:unnamed protein product [Eruca vesicaria subsp. sativa]
MILMLTGTNSSISEMIGTGKLSLPLETKGPIITRNLQNRLESIHYRITALFYGSAETKCSHTHIKKAHTSRATPYTEPEIKKAFREKAMEFHSIQTKIKITKM